MKSRPRATPGAKSTRTPLNELIGFMPKGQHEITIEDYETEIEVEMHDGSRIVLKKLDPGYDPTDKADAFQGAGGCPLRSRSSSPA